MEIRLESIVLDATAYPHRNNKEPKHLLLVEVICSNLWGHRIHNLNEKLLIDSHGFQHSAYSPFDWYKATVLRSKHLKEGTDLPALAEVIEGNAKSRGWIAFPKLGKLAVPHRFIFQFSIFHPGATSGKVLHSETLEIILDLSLFGRLLAEGRTEQGSE